MTGILVGCLGPLTAVFLVGYGLRTIGELEGLTRRILPARVTERGRLPAPLRYGRERISRSTRPAVTGARRAHLRVVS